MSDKNKQENKPNNKKNGKKNAIKAIIALVLIISIAVSGYCIYKNNKKDDDNKVAYTQLIKAVNDGKIKKIEMTVGSTTVKLIYKTDEELKYSKSSKEAADAIKEFDNNIANMNNETSTALATTKNETAQNTISTEEVKDEDKKISIVPNTQAFIELIQDKIKDGSDVELIQNQKNFAVTALQGLVSFLPTLIMVALIVVLFQIGRASCRERV